MVAKAQNMSEQDESSGPEANAPNPLLLSSELVSGDRALASTARATARPKRRSRDAANSANMGLWFQATPKGLPVNNGLRVLVQHLAHEAALCDFNKLFPDEPANTESRDV